MRGGPRGSGSGATFRGGEQARRSFSRLVLWPKRVAKRQGWRTNRGCRTLRTGLRDPQTSLIPRVTSYEISRRPSPFCSATYKMLFAQLLCFENDPFSWGVYTTPLEFVEINCMCFGGNTS